MIGCTVVAKTNFCVRGAAENRELPTGGSLFLYLKTRGKPYVKCYDERCLCSSCKADYETAGYKLKRKAHIYEKDRFDKCGRYGWTYIIKHNQKSN